MCQQSVAGTFFFCCSKKRTAHLEVCGQCQRKDSTLSLPFSLFTLPQKKFAQIISSPLLIIHKNLLSLCQIMRQEQQRQWSYDLPFGRVVITFNDGVYVVTATSPLWTCTFACSSSETAYQEALSLVARIGNIKKVSETIDKPNEQKKDECNLQRRTAKY